MKKKLITTFFIFISIIVFGQQNTVIDSAKKNLTIRTSESDYIKTCFFIADSYMNDELYDSSQIWLNKLTEKLPAKTNSLNNYLLTTRQAEVYYYNNLQQLGLQESRRGLEMAKNLNDSFLLADSYNFLGLFLMNMDSAAKAVPYFKTGILFAKELPYPEKYMSLTKPHHLYGNLAEAYYKIKDYNNSLINYTISLEKANQIKLERGVAVANFGIGEVYLAKLNTDSARFYYEEAISISIASKDLDITLISYSGLAKSKFEKGNYKDADVTLKKGITLLKNNPNINKFYTLIFLNDAYKIYKKQQNASATIEALELKSTIERQSVNGANMQMQTILNAGVANEKKVLSLQVEEAERKQQLANTRLLMTLVGILFLGIAFFVYRYFQKQKQKVYKIRQNISQDLHDDIGASLSSLQIYGTVAEKAFKNNPEKTIEMLHKISTQSKQVMQNMNDIVWSMNANEDNTILLEAKIKNYSVELLSNNNITFHCVVDMAVEQSLKNITAKRNILLIIREALNNISKYSKATTVTLNAKLQNKHLEIKITDNGIGFDYEHKKNGNGIGNMQKRTTELGGIFTFTTKEMMGTNIEIMIPIKAL